MYFVDKFVRRQNKISVEDMISKFDNWKNCFSVLLRKLMVLENYKLLNVIKTLGRYRI